MVASISKVFLLLVVVSAEISFCAAAPRSQEGPRSREPTRSQEAQRSREDPRSRDPRAREDPREAYRSHEAYRLQEARRLQEAYRSREAHGLPEVPGPRGIPRSRELDFDGTSRHLQVTPPLDASEQNIFINEFNSDLFEAAGGASISALNTKVEIKRPTGSMGGRRRRNLAAAPSITPYFGDSLEIYDGCASVCFINLRNADLTITSDANFQYAVTDVATGCLIESGTSMCLSGVGFARTVYYGTPDVLIPCNPVIDPFATAPPDASAENVTKFTKNQIPAAGQSYQRLDQLALVAGTEAVVSVSWAIENATFNQAN